jgi:hypothetical protein
MAARAAGSRLLLEEIEEIVQCFFVIIPIDITPLREVVVKRVREGVFGRIERIKGFVLRPYLEVRRAC